jgi:5-methylcytosine-specific restriction enzyme subunit McrC
MLAYCTELELRRGWLVYAQGAAPVVQRVRHSSIEIVNYPVDLSRGPRAILAQVEALAEEALPS